MPTYYRLTINNATGPAPSDGFIDNKRLEQYMAEGSLPTSADASIAKERANLRFQRLIFNLQFSGNVYVNNIEAIGADANTEPTSISMTLVCERGDEPFIIEDTLNPGTFLRGPDALARKAAETLAYRFDRAADYYDPTDQETIGNLIDAPRYGNRIDQIEVGAATPDLATAIALVTIAPIPGM